MYPIKLSLKSLHTHIFGTNLFVFFGIVANSKESNNQSSLGIETDPVNSRITSIQKGAKKLNQLEIQTKAKNPRKLQNSENTEIAKKSKNSGSDKNSEIRKIPEVLKSQNSVDSGKTIDLTGDSEIQNSSNSSYSIPKIIKKKPKKGTRGKNLRNNPLNNNSYHRRCPPRTTVQKGKLEYHNRVVSNFENSEDPNFKATWYPADLKCHVCNVKCTFPARATLFIK